MTTVSTGTVETLTAEVCVLKVGSRQVTAGTYEQLDRVESSDIEAFGRVRPKGWNSEKVHVVGRHVRSGTLVRASTYVPDDQIQQEAVRSTHALFVASKRQSHGAEFDEVLRAEIDRATSVARSWSALPLIVLAGLR